MTRPSILITIVACLLQTGCTNMFFIPMEPLIRTPAEVGLEYRDVEFESSDGTQLHGWFLPAKTEAMGSILFLHGNAENISTHLGSVYWLPDQGYNVFLFDYRGYGKSGGVPELDGVMRDAEAALATITSLPETQGKPLIVFGQSIGAAIACYAVAHSRYRDHVNALIMESAFSSYRQIAREKLNDFWLTWPFQYPLSWTVSDRYKPIDAIPLIAPIPLLLVYSNEDIIVPPHHGQALYAAANEPKQLWIVPKGSHIAIFTQPQQRQRLLDYLKQITAAD